MRFFNTVTLNQWPLILSRRHDSFNPHSRVTVSGPVFGIEQMRRLYEDFYRWQILEPQRIAWA